jgi:hypothetical protein
MKVYAAYKKMLKNCFDEGYELEKAWFTTFTLSPEFFESYLLPPLLHRDDEIPKSFVQFEEIISALQDDSSANIQVFHDARMPIDGMKKTTVDFIGIKHDQGLFHPKLSLFLFKKANQLAAYIMVGSANISIDGWGRNREAVLIRKIGTQVQWVYVQKFFEGFGQSLDNIQLSGLKQQSSSTDWKLCHSYAQTSLIQEIADLKQDHWKVWSPYFSEPFPVQTDWFLNDLKQTKFSLIPDLVDGKLRLKTLPENTQFYRTDERDDTRFSHAKVWLSSGYLIVGSHNFTQQALMQQNVEVSLIEPLSDSDWFKSVQLDAIDPKVMMNKEFEEEKLPEQLNGFSVHLQADHKSKTITLLTGENQTTINKSLEITLPGNVTVACEAWHGLTKSLKLEIESYNDSAKFWKAIVVDKSVTALVKNSDEIGFGFIQEINIQDRQAFQYASLDNLILDRLNGHKTGINNPVNKQVHVSELIGVVETSSFYDSQIEGLPDYFQIFNFNCQN